MYSTCTRRLSSRPTFIRFSGRMKKPGGAHSRAIRSAHTARRVVYRGGWRRDARRRARSFASSPFVKTLYCRPPGAVFKARTRMYTGRKSAAASVLYIYNARGLSFMITRARRENMRTEHVDTSMFCPFFLPPPRTPLRSGHFEATAGSPVPEEIPRVVRNAEVVPFFRSPRFTRPPPLGRKRAPRTIRGVHGSGSAFLSAAIFNYRVRAIVISRDLPFLVRYSLTSMFLPRMQNVYRIYTACS